MLAESTSIALTFYNKGSSKTLYCSKDNGIKGTLFITDQTYLILFPDETLFFYYNSSSYLSMLLLLKVEITYGVGGADFPTPRAGRWPF